jgi:hypothetical protein
MTVPGIFISNIMELQVASRIATFDLYINEVNHPCLAAIKKITGNDRRLVHFLEEEGYRFYSTSWSVFRQIESVIAFFRDKYKVDIFPDFDDLKKDPKFKEFIKNRSEEQYQDTY